MTPQTHKHGNPLKPIVSGRDAVTYEVAKELANIIRPLTGHSPHHIRNTQHFVQHTKAIQLKQGECISSHDVKALFTSVSVDPTISIINNKLQQDPQLHNRTYISIQHIITLLEFCLKITCFLFQVKYYEQAHGAALGFPICPIVAKLFTEAFESKGISTDPNPPRLWLRYIDGTFAIQQAKHIQWFFNVLIPWTHIFSSS